MADDPVSPRPRDTGARGGGESSGGLRGLLRGLLGSRPAADNFRDTIEELIDQEDAGTEESSSEYALLRNVLRVFNIYNETQFFP